MRKMPPLNAIRSFEAAARKSSFTGAANELNVTVTAISHQIRLLEDTIGVRLFDRDKRTARLTPIGERLFPYLRQSFDKIEEAFAEIDDRKSASVISVTTTRSFAEHWLVPRLTAFKAAYPDLIVNIDASDQVRDLRGGEADLAIRYGLQALDGETAIPLLDDSYVAVCHSSLSPPGKIVRLSQLGNVPLLGYRWTNRGLGGPDWDGWFRLSNDLRSRDFKVWCLGEEGLAIQAMVQGHGPLLCGNVLVERYMRSGICLPVEGPTLPGFTYRLVTTPSASRKSGVRRFSNWMRDEASRSGRGFSHQV